MSRISKFNEFSKSKIFESISDDDKRRALRKMQYCRMMLLKHNSFFGRLAMQLQFIERLDLPYKTMATDGMNLYYDPGFVLKQTEEEIRWVICHEVMHCVLHHFARKMPDPRTWNAACDYALNLLIDPDDQANQGKNLGKIPEGALLDKKYKGIPAEDIYQYLIENPDVIPPDEGWNYGGFMPPVFKQSSGGSGGGGGSSSGGKKVKVGDWVKLNGGGYGEVESIDPATGDVEINPMTEAQIKAAAEAQAGKKVKLIA